MVELLSAAVLSAAGLPVAVTVAAARRDWSEAAEAETESGDWDSAGPAAARSCEHASR